MRSADYRAAREINKERAKIADDAHGKLPRAKFVRLDDGTFGVKFANKRGRIVPGANVLASSLHRSSVVIVGEIVGGEADGSMTARIDDAATTRIREAERAERERERAEAAKAKSAAELAEVASIGIATFTKIRESWGREVWGLRVPLGTPPGTDIIVRRRDGSEERAVVGHIVSSDAKFAYAQIDDSAKQHERRQAAAERRAAEAERSRSAAAAEAVRKQAAGIIEFTQSFSEDMGEDDAPSHPIHAGAIFRKGDAILRVLDCDRQCFKGYEGEWIVQYCWQCVKATEEEAAPVLTREAYTRRAKSAQSDLCKIYDAIAVSGNDVPCEKPDANEWPTGFYVSLKGGFLRLVVEDDGATMWAIKENGMDGDCWANNNIRGAMAWRVGDTAIAQRICELAAAFQPRDEIERAMAEKDRTLSKNLDQDTAYRFGLAADTSRELMVEYVEPGE